jgi:hypothetical protein
MGNDIIMRCDVKSIVLGEVDGGGSILRAWYYPISAGDELQCNSDKWLLAFSQTLSQIPKKIRKNVTFVVPPNGEVFIKHVQIPDVTKKSAMEAFRFECEHEFPGGIEEWYLGIYQIDERSNHAFGVAMHGSFADRMIDILIRSKIQFSFLCPEIFLTKVAIREATKDFTNSMLIHVGTTSTYLVCMGGGVEYFRTLAMAGANLSRTIADSQKISIARAEELQSEFLKNQGGESHAFMTYYTKQFCQKLRQEFKKSELFYCRTFSQSPVEKLFLTGSRKDLYARFKADEKREMVDIFDLMKDHINPKMKREEVDMVRGDIGAFVGAAHCLKNGRSHAKILNLFSPNFSNQVDFQRQNLGYLLITAAVTMLALLGLKVLKKEVAALQAERAALTAKLFQADTDASRYMEISREREDMYWFIKNAKAAFDSQLAWAEVFNELQSQVATLKTAWIDSLSWEDREDGENGDRVKILAKMLILRDESKKSINGEIEKFALSLGKMPAVERMENMHMSWQNDNVLAFSFDLVLKQQSKIFAR